MPGAGQHEPIVRELFDSDAVAVSEFSCPGRPCICPEEAASGLEIVLPRRGAFIRRNHHGQVFADPTRALFFEAGDSYEIRHPIAKPDVSTVISLKDRFIGEAGLRSGTKRKGYFDCGSIRLNAWSGARHFRLLSLLKSSDNSTTFESEEQIQLLVNEILLLWRNQRGSGLHPARRNKEITFERNQEIVSRTIRFLNENYCCETALGQIANAVGCSVFHLCRIFKSHTGRTIHRHLGELRLQAALRLLRESDTGLTYIALDLGYSSHSHFTSQFSRAVGMTPQAYRQNW